MFTLPMASAAILFVSLFTITFLMPFYLVHPMGYPMDKVGGVMMIPFVFLFVGSPVSGALSDRFGSRMLCTLGMAILTASLLLLAGLTAVHSMVDIAWRLALAGIGLSVFLSPNSAAVMSAVPPHRRGIASGSVATARNLGMVIGVATAGLIFNSTFRSLTGGLTLKVYTPGLEPYFMTAFRTAMLTGAATACTGVLVAWLRGKEQRT
jgi:MFS family permease